MPPGIGYVDPVTGQWSPDPPQEQAPQDLPTQQLPAPEVFEPDLVGPQTPSQELLRPQETGLGQLATGLQNMGQQAAQPFVQAHQRFEEAVAPVQQATSLESRFAPGSEQAVQDYDQRSLQAAEAAGQRSLAADQAAASADVVHASRRERIESDHLRATNKLFAERDNRMGAKLGQLQQLTTEIQNTKIDPWRNKSTGQRWAAIAGAAIGGLFIPSLGRNPAMEMMDKMIEQEINMQETELSAKKTALQSGFNMYGMMREHYSDAQAAKDATKAAMLSQAAADFDRRNAGVKNEQAVARHMEFKSALLDKASTHQQNAYSREMQREATNWEKQKQQQALSLNWSQLGETRRHNIAMEGQQELELKAKAEEAKTKGAGKDLRIYGVKFKVKDAEGKDLEQDYIQARTEGSYDKLQEVVNSGQSVLDRLGDIKAIGTQGNLVNDADKAMSDAAWATIRLDMQALVKGIPSDKDQRIIDLKMGTKTPQEVFTLLNKDERLRVINYLEDRTRTETNTRLKTVAGPGASWSPVVIPVTEKPLPQEPDSPQEIRERMVKADDRVKVTPVTNKRNTYSSEFLDAGRQALKADKDPKSLMDTRKLAAQKAAQAAWFGRNNPDQAKHALELQKLVSDIDDKIKKQDYERAVDELRSRRGRGGLVK